MLSLPDTLRLSRGDSTRLGKQRQRWHPRVSDLEIQFIRAYPRSTEMIQYESASFGRGSWRFLMDFWWDLMVRPHVIGHGTIHIHILLSRIEDLSYHDMQQRVFESCGGILLGWRDFSKYHPELNPNPKHQTIEWDDSQAAFQQNFKFVFDFCGGWKSWLWRTYRTVR